MLVSKAAHRYAKSLLGLAEEKKSVEKTLEDVLFIKNTLEDSRDLILFLESPIVKPEQKAAALQAIFEGKISELVYKFVILVAKKGREDLLDEIMAAFIDKYNEYAGILEIEVQAARALDDNQVNDLTEALNNATGKQVKLFLTIDPELKGGLAVKVDDTVIDGTIKHKLEQLQQRFLETAAV